MASKLAVQMFTVRDFTKTGRELADTLRKLRAIGYEAVQLSAVGCMNGESPKVSAAAAPARCSTMSGCAASQRTAVGTPWCSARTRRSRFTRRWAAILRRLAG